MPAGRLRLSLKIDSDGLPIPASAGPRGDGQEDFLLDTALRAVRSAIEENELELKPGNFLDIDLELVGRRPAREGDLENAIESFFHSHWADLNNRSELIDPFNNGFVKVNRINYAKTPREEGPGVGRGNEEIGRSVVSGGTARSGGDGGGVARPLSSDPIAGPVGPPEGSLPTPAEALRALGAGLPAEYRERSAALATLTDSFRRELSALIGSALNSHLRAAPQSNLDEKKALARWLSEELKRFSFSIAHPVTGLPCRIVALDADTDEGRFQVELIAGRQRSHSTPNLVELLPLSLTEGVSRREPLKEWQEKVAGDRTPKRRGG